MLNLFYFFQKYAPFYAGWQSTLRKLEINIIHCPDSIPRRTLRMKCNRIHSIYLPNGRTIHKYNWSYILSYLKWTYSGLKPYHCTCGCCKNFLWKQPREPCPNSCCHCPDSRYGNSCYISYNWNCHLVSDDHLL